METKTLTETGCYLDNHRGHFITRDIIALAVSYGFIISPFAQFAIDKYDDCNHDGSYPFESLVSLADDARDWLNSGQEQCGDCDGTGKGIEGRNTYWIDREGNKRCRKCTGTGRAPRVELQNFPPRIPEGYAWDWIDGDFGLYPYVLFNIGTEDSTGHASVAEEVTIAEARQILTERGARKDIIERLLDQRPDDMALQAGGFIVEAYHPQQ